MGKEQMAIRHQMQTHLRPGIALIALALSAGACFADDLTEKVLQTFRSKATQLRVSAKTDDELQVTGQKGPLTVYLFNVRTACMSNKDRCDDEVSSFVERVASIASEDKSAGAFTAEKIYAVLRNIGFAKRAAETFKETSKQLVVLPFVESIEVLFVVDGEKAVRYVNRDDMDTAGLTEKALLDLASRNSARLPQLKYEPIKGTPGLYFMPANDGLGTSRAFDAALWEKLEAAAGGPVAMAVPTRDWVLFTRADQPESVAKLRTLAGRIAKGEPYPVSDAVMIREKGSWKVF
jgi:uncharacterized protein YtpQ (UPF0354 family)